LRVGIFDQRNSACEIRAASENTGGIERLNYGMVSEGNVPHVKVFRCGTPFPKWK
jgi:hypothetical protein